MNPDTRVSSIRENLRAAVSIDELVSLCRDLVKIPSEIPTGSEEGIARFIGKSMEEFGLDVEFDYVYPNRPNVYGTLRGTTGKPTLILNGHMDTVPVGDGWTEDPHGGVVKGDSIFGRGSADIKGGLTSMLACALILRRIGLKLRGNLLITSVVDEEIKQVGTKHYMDTKGQGDYAIVCEPTELSLCIAEKSQLMYEFNVVGKAAHSSTRREGINAIEKALEIITAIREYAENIARRKHKLLGQPTVNIGTIQGGTVTNVVPSNCTFTLDRRTLPDENYDEIEAGLRQMIGKLSQRDANLHAIMMRFFTLPPFEIAESHSFVSRLRSVSRDMLGRDVPIRAFSGGTDAPFLYPRIPTVIFGPGSLSQAHKPDEYCSVAEILEAAVTYAGVAITLLE